MIALLLLSIVPPPAPALTDRVDLIEYQHYFDEEARPVFDQLIFIRIDRDGNEEVQAWRLVKQPHQIPVRDWQRGGYTLTWLDGDELRTVHAASFRETWGQEDRELIARATLPNEKRKGLAMFRRGGRK